MQYRVQVKAYVLPSLAKALQDECERCGCSISAVVGCAIVEEVRRRRASRRLDVVPLEGQKLLIEKA